MPATLLWILYQLLLLKLVNLTLIVSLWDTQTFTFTKKRFFNSIQTFTQLFTTAFTSFSYPARLWSSHKEQRPSTLPTHLASFPKITVWQGPFHLPHLAFTAAFIYIFSTLKCFYHSIYMRPSRYPFPYHQDNFLRIKTANIHCVHLTLHYTSQPPAIRITPPRLESNKWRLYYWVWKTPQSLFYLISLGPLSTAPSQVTNLASLFSYFSDLSTVSLFFQTSLSIYPLALGSSWWHMLLQMLPSS